MSIQSKHLPVLMAMFPGVVMLDVEQVATILHCAKGHLYNLCSANRLPFKLSRDVGNRFLISIVEMATYMDKTMLSDGIPGAESEPVVVAKRKPGRPRGSTSKAKSQALMAFQSELMGALNKAGVALGDSPVTPAKGGALLAMVGCGKNEEDEFIQDFAASMTGAELAAGVAGSSKAPTATRKGIERNPIQRRTAIPSPRLRMATRVFTVRSPRVWKTEAMP